MTREQLGKLHRLGKKRNTNQVLQRLSEYLNSFREGENTVYYLNGRGKSYVNCQKVRKKGNKALHTIMRNELWLYLGCPSTWRGETIIRDPQTKKVYLIPDARFEYQGRKHFVEIDLIQKMSVNREKIRKYEAMAKGGMEFTLVWLTTTDLRRKQLSEACKSFSSIIYTLSDIK